MLTVGWLSDPGVMFTEQYTNRSTNANTSVKLQWSFGDGTLSERLALQWTTTNRWQVSSAVAAVSSTGPIAPTPVGIFELHKAAVRLEGGTTRSISVNNSAVVQAAIAYSPPATLTQLNFGYRIGASSGYGSMGIRKMAFYNGTYSDADLQALTT
jgi:hypothetical protein